MPKKVLLLEGFYGGSHKRWADDLIKYSSHDIRLITLPGRFWKWRMHGGAITMARRYLDMDFRADVILATDMIDLSLFLSLTRDKTAATKVIVYFHENQMSYPWSPQDRDLKHKRNYHYGFINYTTALCADHVLFNSRYHMSSFHDELPRFLRMYPDHRNLATAKEIRAKSSVLSVGMDFARLDNVLPHPDEPILPKHPVILWNHRWEYDKGAEEFFRLMYELTSDGVDFQMIVLGERTDSYPTIFDEAREKLVDHILHWGYAESFDRYVQLVRMSDLLPVCSRQDFFGISVVEAMWLGVTPLLPDRLAFPEHIMPGWEDTLLYDGWEELVGGAKNYLHNKWKINLKNLRGGLHKYSWTRVEPQFDQLLDQVTGM